jgi:hypothetical protein
LVALQSACPQHLCGAGLAQGSRLKEKIWKVLDHNGSQGLSRDLVQMGHRTFWNLEYWSWSDHGDPDRERVFCVTAVLNNSLLVSGK